MNIEAKYRLDGEPMSEANMVAAPFIGFLEYPHEDRGRSDGFPVMRLEGWACPRAGRGPVRVTARAGGAAAGTVHDGRERRDVAAAIGDSFPMASIECGFVAHVPLPQVEREQDVSIVVTIDDGEYGCRLDVVVRHRPEPPPTRSDYKSAWEAVSEDYELAKLAVWGNASEEVISATGAEMANVLDRTVGIDADDVVLEIGCGVGRVGAEVAPRCRRWIGTDVSENMLGHARKRLLAAGVTDAQLVALSGWELTPIDSDSIDVVYCAVVFMHLDEWDRFNYVREAMRVLRPGGRVYVDSFGLECERGWQVFVGLADRHHPLERPPNISKSSTALELRIYLERAGFRDVQHEECDKDLWVRAWGRKPS